MIIEHSFFKKTKFAPLLIQFERFCYTGGLCFIIDYGLMVFLTEFFSINYLLSATISFIFAVFVNFKLSITWVYNFRKEKVVSFARVVLPFFILSTVGLMLNNFVMVIAVEILSIHYTLGKIFATAIVMFFNFWSRKILLEGRKKDKEKIR